MGMQQYDQLKCGNGLLATINLATYKQAVASYFKSAECIAEYQAFVRGNANAAQTIVNALTGHFNGRPQGPTVQPAQVKQYLYTQADNYFTMTIRTQGDQRLTTEQQTRNTYWTTGAGKGEFPDLFEYWQQGLAQTHASHLITPRQGAGYLDLLAAIIQPYQAKTDHNEYTQNYKQAVKAVNAIGAARGVMQNALKAEDGSLNQEANQWKTVKECVNYWQTELERQKVRQPVLDAMGNLGRGGQEAKLFRLVSTPEKDFIKSKGKLAQGPGSYERHKWFFYTFGGNTGNPSVGHEWKIEVKITDIILNFLLGQAVECGEEKADSKQAFIKKSNEQNCVGIHEDVLRPFHALIGSFKITSMKNASLAAQNVNVQP